VQEAAPFRAFANSSDDALELPSSQQASGTPSAAERAVVAAWHPGNGTYQSVDLSHVNGVLRISPAASTVPKVARFLPPRVSPSSTPPSSPQEPSEAATKPADIDAAPAPNKALAQRRSGRRTATRVSYADSPEASDASENGGDSSDDAEYHREEDDEQVWVEFDSMPERMSQRRRRAMETALVQWQDCLSDLIARENWSDSIAVLLIHRIPSSAHPAWWARCTRCYNPVKTSLVALRRSVSARLRSLKKAKPVGSVTSRLAEVDDLWKELEANELPIVKARVNRCVARKVRCPRPWLTHGRTEL
jgi:hypothetical protein